MNLKDDFVSVRIADLLKENGFDEWCGTCYIDGQFNYGTPIKNSDLTKGVVSAPTMSFAMKWLREKYNVFISIIREKGCYSVDVCDTNGVSYCDIENPQYFDTYYDAAESTLFNVLADLHIWVKDGYAKKSERECVAHASDEYFAKHLEYCYGNNPIAYLAAMEMAARRNCEMSPNFSSSGKRLVIW